MDDKVGAIMFRICSECNVSADEVMGRSRKKEVVRARRLIYRNLYFKVGMIQTAIADIFGRDHSSVSRVINSRGWICV